MFKKYTGCFLGILFSIVFSSNSNAGIKPSNTGVVNIPYGQNYSIKYNLKTGTYNVYRDGANLFVNVYSSAKVNADTVNSKSYELRKYTKLAIKDGFGKGFKHTIVLTGKGLPQMKQVFYTYAGKNYFLTEVTFTGSQLKSNYIAPVTGQFKRH
jgi:alpha-galactosidase